MLLIRSSASNLLIFGLGDMTEEFVHSLIRRYIWLPHYLQLAPSPRILVYLARRQRSPTTMALTIPQEESGSDPIPDTSKPEVFVPPPDVVITPFRPWPRPYLLEDGLRKVAPYHFTYNTYCKARWRGRELIDIFATEFRDRPQTYYVNELPSL